MKESVDNLINKLNGFTNIPQKTTLSGFGVILYQLADLLEKIEVGGFFKSFNGMFYGDIITGYAPIIGGIILIFFNENKFFASKEE